MKKNLIGIMQKEVILQLSMNGRQSLEKIAKSIGHSARTIKKCLHELENSSVMKVSALINEFRAKDITVAVVGIKLAAVKQSPEENEFSSALEKIAKIPCVTWVALTSGKFDIIAEVISTDGVYGISKFTSKYVRACAKIHATESFMIMDSRKKWIEIPEKMKSEVREEWVNLRK